MKTVFSRDCNVHLLLDHKINQKTRLIIIFIVIVKTSVSTVPIRTILACMIIYHLLIGNDSYIQTTQDNNKIIKLCQEILLLSDMVF